MRKKNGLLIFDLYIWGKIKNMEHEIGNISIARIRQMNPCLKRGLTMIL